MKRYGGSVGEDLFPARLPTTVNVVVKDDNGKAVGCADPATQTVAIPVGDDAYSRTVRLHEAQHLLICEAGKPASRKAVDQALEDIKVHQSLKVNGTVGRDELASALIDLRLVGSNPLTRKAAKAHTQAVAATARALTIVNKYHKPSRYVGLLQAVESAIGARNAINRIQAVIKLLGKGERGRARRRLARLMGEYANSEVPRVLPPKPKSGNGANRSGKRPQLTPLARKAVIAVSHMRTALASEYTERLPKPNPMTVRRLPLKMPKQDFSNSLSKGMAMMGHRVKGSRLASAALGFGRPFKRRKLKTQGGTVLIDASGSMSLSAAQIARLADRMPAGRVAYYSGQDSSGCPAEDYSLVVFAENGRVAEAPEDEDDLPYRHYGNGCDYNALMWLLNQPAPRILVSDLGFCGEGIWGGKALDIVEQAVREGDLVVLPNLGSCMKYFPRVKEGTL